VLSDVHGNRWALEAVLLDIERAAIDIVVNLGDSVYGPLDPEGTARILRALGGIAVAGNEDRLLLEPAMRSRTLDFVRDGVSGETMRWLAERPSTATLHEVVTAFHGTPDSDTTYLLSDVATGSVRLWPEPTIRELLGAVSSDLILCGHDHVPQVIRLADGRTILNPGSVGCPAFTDDQPVPHTVANRAPHARYAIAEHGPWGWQVKQIAVPYDWEAAAEAARSNGFDDWARWIRSGNA